MSFGSRLSSLLRTAARSPAVRRTARDLGRAAVRSVSETRSGRSGSAARRRANDHGGEAGVSTEAASALADRDGSAPLAITYAPRLDGHPDPGEIVWAWVPYEEDLSRGKDRPVLVLAQEDARAGGRDGEGEVLVALMLTSRDRAESGGMHVDEHGATWIDVGSGSWDSKGRPSEVRVDRLLRLSPQAVRREGSRLAKDRFDRVAAAAREVHGWDG